MTQDNLRFIELKNTKDIQDCHRENYKEWGNILTVDQYLQREKVFRSQESTKDGRLTFWALQEFRNSHGWVTVCAMESLKRPSFYKQKGLPIKDSVSHSIGAVFTPAEYRGKGYGSKMITMATEKLNDWQLDDYNEDEKATSFQTLWSDVGDYYKKFGYESESSKEIKVDVGGYVEWPNNVEKVYINDVDELAKQDVEDLKQKMDKQTEQDGIIRVAIKPSAAIHHTTFQRAIFLSKYMARINDVPKVMGAKYKNSWILWTHDFTADKLTSLRLFINDSDPQLVAEKLVQAAISETTYWKFPSYTHWIQDLPTEQINPEKLASSLAKFGTSKFHDRPATKSLPMFKSHKFAPSSVKWVYGGRYGWF